MRLSGQIAIYLHGTSIGVMVDFSGGDEQLGKDIAMHIAAANPQFLSREAVPADVLNRERAVYEAQAKESGKPAAIIGKMVDGKLEKFYTDTCLMDQIYIKDPDGKIKIKNIVKNGYREPFRPLPAWRRHRKEKGKLRRGSCSPAQIT